MPNNLLVGALAPIVSRVRTSTCCVKRPQGAPRRVKSPLTADRLARHVNGGPAYGVYPMEPGSSTTRVALFDLDAHHGETPWPEMQSAALALMQALEARGLKPLPFRSSGGAGIHVYVLWDAPQDARSVRTFMRAALAAAGFTDGPAGVAAGEIEVFPKQDSVPEDGYGNMFVLPLAGASVPLDPFELDDMPREWAASMEWPASPAVPLAPPEPREPVSSSDVPVELQLLKSALDAIPNSGEFELDYDSWRNVIFGIHHATQGSDEGRQLAHEFSARSTKYDAQFLDARVWQYVHDNHDELITARSILHIAARDYGWEEPIADEFDVLEPDEPEGRINSFQPALERAEEAIKPDLIKGVVPDADFGIVFGAPGAGKSFAAIDLGFHLALGRSWRGRKTKQRRVFYVAAEGAHGVRRRVKAWARHHGVTGAVPFYTRERAINLYAKNGWVKAAEDINEIARKERGVIFIDTLSRSIPGVEENSAKDMSQVIENCHALGRATGCMVIVIAHAGKDAERGVRGSSTLRAAADFELSVTRHLETPWRCVKLTKAKDDIDGTEFGFTLTSVEVGKDEDEEVVYSAVAAPSDERPAAAAQKPRSAVAARALDAYLELAEFSDDGWVEVEKVIDRALEGQPEADHRARYNVRRWITGANKLEIFDVFDGKVRASVPQGASDDI
jgi:hypothetical protein